MVHQQLEVTVCMVTRCKTLREVNYLDSALRSILNQGFVLPYEVIIINDASPEEKVQEVVQKYVLKCGGDKKVRFVVNPENMGIAVSCNIAISMARGKYFVRLDGDDFALPNFLDTLYREYDLWAREQSAGYVLGQGVDGIVACFGDYIVIDGSDFSIRETYTSPYDIFSLQAAGVMYPVEMLKKVGGYRDLFYEEHDLHLRLQGMGEFDRVPEPLWIYRKHKGGVTEAQGACKEGWRQLKRALPGVTMPKEVNTDVS